MKPITLLDIKMAMRDRRFRESLPVAFAEDIQKYLKNPGCACNMPLYRKIISEATTQIQEYYPAKTVVPYEEEVKKVAENHWSVINCHVNELEAELRKLPPGRKQLAITRFEDQATVVVNELDYLY